MVCCPFVASSILLVAPYPTLLRSAWVPQPQPLPTVKTAVNRRPWLARCAGKCAELSPIQVGTQRIKAGLHSARAANLLFIKDSYLIFLVRNQ